MFTVLPGRAIGTGDEHIFINRVSSAFSTMSEGIACLENTIEQETEFFYSKFCKKGTYSEAFPLKKKFILINGYFLNQKSVKLPVFQG